MDKLSQTALNKLLKGIVGAAISIESIRGTRKLSQNKSDECNGSVWCRRSAGPASPTTTRSPSRCSGR
jgi:predicted FMN-binding regulatory protein PaiB